MGEKGRLWSKSIFGNEKTDKKFPIFHIYRNVIDSEFL